MHKSERSKVIAFRPRVRKPTEQKPNGDGIEYQETIEIPRRIRIALYTLFGLVILYFLISPILSQRPHDPVYLLLALVFGLVAWVVHLFLSLRVKLTSETITFGFYLFNKTIPYNQIVDCSVIRYNLLDFMGWGIRKGTDGVTLYNIPGDQRIAVKIRVREEEDQRKEYAFSSKRPQVVCRKIQTHLYQGPTRDDKKADKKESPLSPGR